MQPAHVRQAVPQNVADRRLALARNPFQFSALGRADAQRDKSGALGAALECDYGLHKEFPFNDLWNK
jgi:hypothetical protein